MFDSIYYSQNRTGTGKRSLMAARRLREKESGRDKKLCSLTNFNPLAVSGCIYYKVIK